MADKRIVGIDDYLNTRSKLKGKRKNKKKGFIGVIAGLLVLTTAITGLVHLGKRKKDDTKNINTKPTHSVSIMSDVSSLSDIGNELEFPEETKAKYGKVISGNIDVNKIVEKDGTIYVDQEAANKADNVGKVSIDTKNGTLKVESNGTVKEKKKGYQIVDSTTGKVISQGNLNENEIPEGFEYDEELDGIYEEKDNVEELTYADANYYDSEGTLVLRKGDLVSEETLKRAKKELSTTKPKATESTAKATQATTKPKVTQATTKPKVTQATTKPKSTQSNTAATESTQISTSAPKETEPKETIKADEGSVNSNGTYTIYGMTFQSKADYQQWILQGYEGYGEVDGIMKAENEEMKAAQKVR